MTKWNKNQTVEFPTYVQFDTTVPPRSFPPTDEQLIQELRQLNGHLAALLAIAQGPMLTETLQIATDLRKMAASALGYRVR
ncbi:MAG: hypothetical protein DDT21_02289 [Syntrophomonadaceae bacterium]|nr:hypothetical protein [Bacillota bacterium]